MCVVVEDEDDDDVGVDDIKADVGEVDDVE